MITRYLEELGTGGPGMPGLHPAAAPDRHPAAQQPVEGGSLQEGPAGGQGPGGDHQRLAAAVQDQEGELLAVGAGSHTPHSLDSHLGVRLTGQYCNQDRVQ